MFAPLPFVYTLTDLLRRQADQLGEALSSLRGLQNPSVGAVDRGLEYLAAETAKGADGIQSVISSDTHFSETLALPGLRAKLAAQYGRDVLDFDAGPEAFSTMVAMKLLGDLPDHDTSAFMVTLEGSLRGLTNQELPGRFHFFRDNTDFAADTDCTGIGALSLYRLGFEERAFLFQAAREVVRSAAGEQCDDPSLVPGVFMVYWEDGVEPKRGRKQDPAVAANALLLVRVAQELGLEVGREEARATFGFVLDHLRSGRYLSGTRYYPSPDTFLYFLSQLCEIDAYRAALTPHLERALRERRDASGGPGDTALAINRAQRLIAAKTIGASLDYAALEEQLLETQSEDGSWEAAPFFSLGRRKMYFGSRAVTTAFALKALAM